MKKVVVLLVVFALTAPVFAQAEPNVYITCSDEGVNSTISYDATAAGVVRAFSMDLTVDGGATIDAISEYDAEGEPGGTVIPVNYSIYMSSIDFGTDPNNVDAWGNPVASGVDALGGLGTAGITVEMGSLYDMDAEPEPDTPPLTGDLFTITVSGECDLTIEDTIQKGTRGGIVLEDGSGANLVSSGCHLSGDCFPNTYTTYADWVTLGKPDCWCTAYQCDGDADGATSGMPFNYRVYSGDLNLVWDNWKKKIADATLNPCADIDHKDSGMPFKYRVYSSDLNIIWTNWKAKDAGLPGDCPRPE